MSRHDHGISGTQRSQMFFADRLIDCAKLLGHFNHLCFEGCFPVPTFVNDPALG